MIERAFFISETYLKENSPLNSHTEVKELYPYMLSAEETYIQEAIGTRLFDRLIASLNASPKNTTANEKELLFKIRRTLVWYICYDAIPFLDVKIRNVGVVQQAGNDLKNVEQEKIAYLRKQCKDKGDFYCRIMQKWLCENSEKFPEYKCSNWNCSELTPNRPVGTSCDLAFDRNDRTEIDTAFARKWLNNG
jgi:hypothetical protein